jgi:hypothetical protein
MSIFHLSATFCEELTRRIRNYWWGLRREKGKLIGSLERNSPEAKAEAASALGISSFSIKPYSLDKFGDYLLSLTVCVLAC